jgi:putative ABC transport system permease protein
MTESLLLTAVAGMSGILFAVMLLQMLQMGSMENGMVTVHYQIGFWTAIGATIMISILGMLAGLPPALRAMSVKPVDAMRDE